jgi:26S proteasome regulatory subunit T3
MGDVAVENPANALSSYTKAAPVDTIPNIDSLEGTGVDDGDEYATLKKLQRHLEYVVNYDRNLSLELTNRLKVH